MSSEAYAALLSAAGHRVVRTDSTWWYEAHPRWFVSVAIHAPLTPAPSELRAVFRQGAWVVRFPCPTGAGSQTYLSVCDDRDYGLASLSSTARRATRRGLERCRVRRIAFGELEGLGGLELSRSTLARQHRKIPGDHDEYWRRHYAAADEVDSAECWGAFANGRLVSFLTSVTIDSTVYLLVLKSATEHLSEYPNNAIVFECTQDALRRPGVTEVSWGLESLLPSLGSLERFKQGMGFHNRAIDQRIEVTPALSLVPSRPTAWAASKLASHMDTGQTVGRAAAFLKVRTQQPRLPLRS